MFLVGDFVGIMGLIETTPLVVVSLAVDDQWGAPPNVRQMCSPIKTGMRSERVMIL